MSVLGSLPMSAERAAQVVKRALAISDVEYSHTQGDGMSLWSPVPFEIFRQKPVVMVLGAFDGFHRGHKKLVRAALAEAQARDTNCVAVTFSPDPSELVGASGAELRLLSIEDRIHALECAGAHAVLALDFTQELASRQPEEFVREVLCSVAPIAALFVGEEFRFGARGTGNVETLRGLSRELGFALHPVALVRESGDVISASRIRALLGEPGRIEQANALLERCHFVRGRVVRGRGEGTSFGFPTANVRCAQGTCMPSEGVYGGFVAMGREAWPAAINVGAPISFGEVEEYFLEANLIGFSDDIYDAEVAVVFATWLRGMRKFDSLEELEHTVLSNIDWVRTNLGGGRLEVLRDN